MADELDQALQDAATDYRSRIGSPESFLRGAGQSVSLGFGDESSGALDTLGAQVLKVLGKAGNVPATPGMLADLGRTYKERRDFYRGQNRAAQEANPLAFGAGQATGAAVLPPVAGAATPLVLGGLSGAGLSEADNPTGLLTDAAKGTAAGGVAKMIGTAAQGAPARVAERAGGAATGPGPMDLLRPTPAVLAGHAIGGPEGAAIGALAATARALAPHVDKLLSTPTGKAMAVSPAVQQAINGLSQPLVDAIVTKDREAGKAALMAEIFGGP